MAKKRVKKRRRARLDEFDLTAVADGGLSDLRFNRNDHIVCIFVPSHDRTTQPLAAGFQGRWANAAMERLADLFEGATALQCHKGIYKSPSGRYLWDDTILIQSFARKVDLEDVVKLRNLLAFAHEMCAKLKQECVLVVFDNLMRYIR